MGLVGVPQFKLEKPGFFRDAACPPRFRSLRGYKAGGPTARYDACLSVRELLISSGPGLLLLW